ncbi:MAG: methyltransferase domain-containing protein [Planctomycetota bacterium]|nr:methyltransferase domain-containing protein [Planctomycetota bacterium]
MASATLSDTATQTATLSHGVLEPKGLPGGGAACGEWAARFDAIYREAAGDMDRVPWAHRRACPSMIAWLNAEAPALVRCGARAAVVGCGLGMDAAALVERGYDVVALDVSPTAIEWARRLHPAHADMFVQADIFDLPSRLRNRFDLVIEVHTLQALPPEYRSGIASGAASLLSPRGGILLAVCRGREPGTRVEISAGPPFALTRDELVGLMTGCGLSPVREVDEFLDENSPPVRRLRGAFRR